MPLSFAPSLSSPNQAGWSNEARRCRRTGRACSYPRGFIWKFHWGNPTQPLFLLQCQPCSSITLIQQSTLRTGRSILHGLWDKGCPRDNTQQLSKVRDRKIWMWNERAVEMCTSRHEGKGPHTLVCTDLVALGVELQSGMTRSGLQGPSIRKRLLCSPYAHLSPLCCFSTALLTPCIHSRPTEPAELRESTAT